MFKKASYAIRFYRWYSKAWDWWQTVRKAWRERNMATVVNGVPTKAPIWAKINWTAFGVLLVSLFDLLGKTLNPGDADAIGSAFFNVTTLPDLLTAALSVLIIIFRTFYNNTVTKTFYREVK